MSANTMIAPHGSSMGVRSFVNSCQVVILVMMLSEGGCTPSETEMIDAVVILEAMMRDSCTTSTSIRPRAICTHTSLVSPNVLHPVPKDIMSRYLC